MIPLFFRVHRIKYLYNKKIQARSTAFFILLNRYKTMSAQQAYDYAQAVCEREKWRCSYENILIVLNQMDMSLND